MHGTGSAGNGARAAVAALTDRLGGFSAIRPYIAAFLLMALCTRARVGAGLAPFAAAYFAASLLLGRSLPALLLGCVTGAFITGFSAAGLYAAAGCAVTLALWLLWDAVSRRFPAASLDRASVAALLSGISVLLPGLAAAGYAPLQWLFTLSMAVAAAVLGAVFASGRPVRGFRDRLSMAAWACAGILCIAALGIDPLPAAVCIAVLAGCAGCGAAAGCALGAVCMVSGNGVWAVALAGSMGAAADFSRAFKDGGVWRSLAGALAFVPIRLFLGEQATLWALAGCAVQALAPPGLVNAVAGTFAPRARRDERVTQALMRRAESGLRNMSDAFGALSEACGAGDPAFGEQQLITRMRGALCSGCPDYAACWPGANSRAVKLFCQLMTASIEKGCAPFENGEIPPDIMRLCRRGMTVPARLGALLGDFAAQRHRRVRLMEARRLIARQFGQGAELLNALADEQLRPFVAREGIAERARETLCEAGLPVRDALAVRLHRLEITVELRAPWSDALLATAETILGRALGRPFSVERADDRCAVFVPGGQLAAPAAARQLPADPDTPCGDSHMIRALDSGRVLAAISDGMGSGEAASEESSRVLRLMHSLIMAGIPGEMTVSTVNGVMLARGGEELFATVDMVVIDLAESQAEFTKLSACRSYIVRGGELIAVDGGRLPLGILDSVSPGVTRVKIKPGDVIYMMSDGVSDALPENVLEQLMIAASPGPPSALAETLLNAAAARAPQRRDDMTALCLRIESAC